MYFDVIGPLTTSLTLQLLGAMVVPALEGHMFPTITGERATHRDIPHATIKEVSQAVAEVPISSDLDMHQQSDEWSMGQVTASTDHIGISDHQEQRYTSHTAILTSEAHSSFSSADMIVFNNDKNQAVASRNRGDNLEFVEAMTTTMERTSIMEARHMAVQAHNSAEIGIYHPATVDQQQDVIYPTDSKRESNESSANLRPEHNHNTLDVTAARESVLTTVVVTAESELSPSNQIKVDATKHASRNLHEHDLEGGDLIAVERVAPTNDVVIADPVKEPFGLDTTQHHDGDLPAREFQQCVHEDQFEANVREHGGDPFRPAVNDDDKNNPPSLQVNPGAPNEPPENPRKDHPTDLDVAVPDISVSTIDIMNTESTAKPCDLATTEDHKELQSALEVKLESPQPGLKIPYDDHLEGINLTATDGKASMAEDTMITEPTPVLYISDTIDQYEEEIPLLEDEDTHHKHHIEVVDIDSRSISKIDVTQSSIVPDVDEHRAEVPASFAIKLELLKDHLEIRDERQVDPPDVTSEPVATMPCEPATAIHHANVTSSHDSHVYSIQNPAETLRKTVDDGASTASVIAAGPKEVHLRSLNANLSTGDGNQSIAMDDNGVSSPSHDVPLFPHSTDQFSSILKPEVPIAQTSNKTGIGLLAGGCAETVSLNVYNTVTKIFRSSLQKTSADHVEESIDVAHDPAHEPMPEHEPKRDIKQEQIELSHELPEADSTTSISHIPGFVSSVAVSSENDDDKQAEFTQSVEVCTGTETNKVRIFILF